MEDSLGQDFRLAHEARLRVLILVVMEDSLGHYYENTDGEFWQCLNPCCNGR